MEDELITANDDTSTTLNVLAGVTLSAIPLALLIEFAFRKWILGPDFEQLRQHLAPDLSTPAWGVFALALVFALSAPLLLRRLSAAGDNPEKTVAGFVVTSSLVQLPLVVLAGLLLFGAPGLPVMLGVAVGSASIVWLYRQAKRGRQIAD